MIFLRKTGWCWHMLCLPSDVQPLEWLHPINSVRTLCAVPKAFLQPRFRIKMPSRPEDTFQLPICFLSLRLNSLTHKMGLERAQGSRVSHRCLGVEGWKETTGQTFSQLDSNLVVARWSQQVLCSGKSKSCCHHFSQQTALQEQSCGSHWCRCLLYSYSYTWGLQDQGQYCAKAVKIRHAVRMTYCVFTKNKQTAVVWVYRPIKHPSKDEWKFW